MIGKKSNSKMARVCGSCGSEDLQPYKDEVGFHFRCLACGHALAYEVPREKLEEIKKNTGKK